MPSTATTTIYLIKVAVHHHDDTIWRLIALRGDQTLDDLHEAIFEVFDREDDEHLYAFYLGKRNTRGLPLSTARRYTHPDDAHDNAHDASATTLDALHLRARQKLQYVFDFGDEWWHDLTVESTRERPDSGPYPRLVESHGDSPPQYEDPEQDSGDGTFVAPW